MPKLLETTSAPRVDFVVSVPLDLLNAMYFTSLVEQSEGVEDWPAQVRRELDPDLRAELDFLFTFPAGQPGVMGFLNDLLFAHREAWTDIEALLRFIRQLPDGVEELPGRPGLQGLVLDAARWSLYITGVVLDPRVPARDAVARAVSEADLDVDAALKLFDRPQELRERMVALIERFYEEHYRRDLARRLPCLERSAAAHQREPVTDIADLARALCRRPEPCIEEEPSAYSQFIFVPSLDMGPYISCADRKPIHGLYYPCEARFTGAAAEDEETRRLARVYKALGDEQRLRILHLLRDGELYAQQIVERTGLHQSVVSRHLSFMRAVGLVTYRRQNNMKFYSLNPQMREELGKTLDLFLPVRAG